MRTNCDNCCAEIEDDEIASCDHCGLDGVCQDCVDNHSCDCDCDCDDDCSDAYS